MARAMLDPEMFKKNNFIRGKVVEIIIEEMLRDLGMFVLKLGKETTLSPLTQLEGFIKACEGKFKLRRNHDRNFIYPIDSVIIHPTG